MLVLSVDTGNKAIKTENLSFNSGIQTMDMMPGEKEEVLRYRGKYYMPASSRITYLEDKTVDDRYYLLTLIAVAKELGRLDSKEAYVPKGLVEVDLLVGLPPAHYGMQRKKFRDYFFREGGMVDFGYMDREYRIAFHDVRVYIQAYAAYFLLAGRQKLSAYPKVLLIDIGGITVDYMILRYGCIDRSFLDSLEDGIVKLYRNVKAGIRKKHGILLEETDIDGIIRNQNIGFGPAVVSRVREMAEEYVVELLGTYREVGIDFKTTLTVFSGGGSILLADYIKKIWERYGGEYFIVQDEKANARGYKLQYLAEKGAL